MKPFTDGHCVFPKTLDEKMLEEERNGYSLKRLPACQRYRGGVSLPYYEYELNFYQIALWSIAPLPPYRNPLPLQRGK